MSFLLLQTFPYLPLLFFLSPSILLLPTPLLIFSVPLPSHPTPLPFPSSLSLLHVLLLLQTSPIFLHSFSFPLLSSYSPFSFFHTLHPSYRPSPIVLLPTPLLISSVPVPPYLTPLPFPSSLSLPHVLPPPTDHPLSCLLSLPIPPLSCPLRSPMPYFPHAFPFCSFSTRIQLCYYYC